MSRIGKTKFTTKDIAIMGILVAMSIVLTRLLSINTPTIRIGFGFIPIVIAGILYGAIPAGVVSVLADVLGQMLVAIGVPHPGITLNAFLTGFVFGIFLYNDSRYFKTIIAVAINQLIISLVIQTYWLYGLQHLSGFKAYLALLISRIPQACIVSIAQLILIPLLFKLVDRIDRSLHIRKNPNKTI